MNDGAVKRGYKQTEVGVIPNDWREYTVGDLIDFEGGSQPNKSVFRSSYKDGYVRLIQIRDYKTDRYETYLPIVLARRFCSVDDIMIGRYGPPIFQILRGLSGAYNVALIKATPRPQLDRRYAYYFLKREELFSFVDKLSQRSSGQTGVDLRELRAYPFPIPPTRVEQEAVAEALSDADALIESLEQLLTKKRHLKQGAMQELLTGKKRLPGFGGDWKTTTIGEVADLYQPATISAREFSAAGFPVYGANGIVGFYRATNHHTWQVTITCRGSTCGTVNRTQGPAWITGNAMVINCDHNEGVFKEFLYYLLCNQNLSECITGTGQPQIVRAPLAAFPIPFPPTREEQTAIAAVLSDMDAELAAVEARLAKARLVKQGMMQELLTGRIRLV